MLAEHELELYSTDYALKSKWVHYAINKPIRLQHEDSDNKFNCFETGIGCQVAMSVGIGTFQGLVIRVSNMINMGDVHLENNFLFKRSKDATENSLLSQKQVAFILQRLLEAAMFYKEHEKFHGDFCPDNISKSN